MLDFVYLHYTVMSGVIVCRFQIIRNSLERNWEATHNLMHKIENPLHI